MKTQVTLAALFVCVVASSAFAQGTDAMMMRIQPETRLIERPNDGPVLTHSEYLGLTVESHNGRGLKVMRTGIDSAADSIGLEKGDIVLGAEGYYVDSMDQSEDAMRRSGGRLDVTVVDVRTGRRVEATMTMGTSPGGLINPVTYVAGLGVEVMVRVRGGYEISRVERHSVAEKIGLTVGDVILKVEGQKIEDVRDPGYVFSKSFTMVYDDAETGYRYTLNRRVWTP